MEQLTIKQIAAILDVTERHARRIVNEEGSVSTDPAEFGRWLRGRADGADLQADRVKAQTRKDDALARKTELEIAVREGELIEFAEAVAGSQMIIMRCRTRLLRLPSDAAPLVVGEGDVHNVRETLQGFVYDALTELSVPPEAAEPEESDDDS